MVSKSNVKVKTSIVNNFLLLIPGFLFFISCNVSKTIQVKSVTANDDVWNPTNVTDFENKLEDLRNRYHIPSLSVGIVNEKKLAWKKGFGYSHVENKKVPDENTVYQLASITKTFGSIILMQLVEEGKVSLDDPISKYGIDLGGRWGHDERIKVKHLLTHTASGNAFNGFKPGYSFRYNGDWYHQLVKVIEKASGKSFGELLMQNIIHPLHLKNTVPSIDDSINFSLTGYNKDSFSLNVARPYNRAGKKLNPVTFKYSFGPAAGIMSSVSDLATYSMAIDEKLFLKNETWEQVFTSYVTPKGKPIQYGLGWYVTWYDEVKIVWHTGWWFGYSSLLLKIPEKDLTFIILANSQDLSRPFYYTFWPLPLPRPFERSLNSDVMVSDFAKAFIDHFVGLLWKNN